ncbi:SAM-dependent methyltransferase [Streptomyces sp. WAC 06738]|uniref:class I SAM-dependent methyltransferase n=1 Tax=Streptomyces sp. WAC 06738 TaxID=2203210 RepID=UPI000F6BAA65|nr:class I SAM-dependent methyltransferase [Streptomyces sp. WAC 06738]AZM48667.1 SAM-dependent methyltransferase [Streptomyces sp. WAC 06738]
MSEGRPTSDRILRLITGYWATGIVGTASKYGLFTHIEDGVRTVDGLAARAELSTRGTQALLDGLVSMELLELRAGEYHNTEEAATYLVDHRPTSLTGFAQFKMGHMDSLADLPEVVRAGGPLSTSVVGVVDNPYWEALVQALAATSLPATEIAADVLGIAGAGEMSLLDIGGGSGIYSRVWLQLNTAARATQLDWAPINRIARRLLAEHGVGDRVDYIDGNFHTTDFGGSAYAPYDYVVYSNIARQEGPEENMALFDKARSALKPGGTLVVADYVVDDDRGGGPRYALQFASEMLLKSTHGSTWRRADYHAWLTKTGYEEITFQPTPSPTTLIFAR